MYKDVISNEIGIIEKINFMMPNDNTESYGLSIDIKTEDGRVLNHICCDTHKENDHIFIHVMSLLCEIYSVNKLNDIIGKSIICIIHNKDTIIGVEPDTENYNLEKHCKYLNNFC